mmetsp:Transcript_42473/g.83476  ORF Transcript_42473/g.83476 Transcript_42473/m.83476 type:complete len:263 (-) Transcript_42473:291-1079(-)
MERETTREVPITGGRAKALATTSDEHYVGEIQHLPPEILHAILTHLPSLYRFLAPVSRDFLSSYKYVNRGKCETHIFGISTLPALQMYLQERNRDNEDSTVGDDPREAASYVAAGAGQPKLVEWSGVMNIRTSAGAARGGRLKTLMWLRKKCCNWNSWTCEKAAKGGHLEILKWARENGCAWGCRTCMYAAGGGHLDILEWLRENGCDWDSSTCAHAAEGGHLHVLKWARGNGCEWDWQTLFQAARGGHLDILQWARENGCR